MNNDTIFMRLDMIRDVVRLIGSSDPETQKALWQAVKAYLTELLAAVPAEAKPEEGDDD